MKYKKFSERSIPQRIFISILGIISGAVAVDSFVEMLRLVVAAVKYTSFFTVAISLVFTALLPFYLAVGIPSVSYALGLYWFDGSKKDNEIPDIFPDGFNVVFSNFCLSRPAVCGEFLCGSYSVESEVSSAAGFNPPLCRHVASKNDSQPP